jgi:hypothetical protein
MGIRGELFSTRLACDGRTYFFNVKQNRNGDVFLSIVESKPSEGESFDRRSIVIFGDQMEGFLKSFQSALKFIDKTGTKVAPDPTAYSRRDGDDDDGERPFRRPDSRARPDSRPRTDSRPRSEPYARPEPRARRDGEAPREGRASSFRERDSSERKPARHIIVKSGPSGRSGAAAGRTAYSARPGASKYPDKAGKATAGSHGADKPVKRIVVRKAKKQDSAD